MATVSLIPSPYLGGKQIGNLNTIRCNATRTALCNQAMNIEHIMPRSCACPPTIITLCVVVLWLARLIGSSCEMVANLLFQTGGTSKWNDYSLKSRLCSHRTRLQWLFKEATFWPHAGSEVVAHMDLNKAIIQNALTWYCVLCYQASVIPRPLPDFVSQPQRKIGRKPGIITTSRTGNGGHG